ncbi:uncharacterized protein LOC110445825 [Mizuhopecten yessoensis]|uniref:Peroxisomal membrane protein 2 n=1 Tax=Mizuhopecten yessoensis TaxID=6573 RepID=A0A210QYS3_MIZYE|nr:uncharacterized protein LOC110445825 [Mizuhopecten yessoensis]OWF53886.1 Peroxisomal membrane protein 2 [Mizuhopecten yessoensis]
MKTPLIVWILWILTSYFVCGIGANANLNCSDYKGNIIQDGKTFQPTKDMCQTCQCDNGFPIMCQSVKCAPPTTPCNWIPLIDQCCKFECPEKDLTGGGDNSINSTKPVDNGVDEASSDSITTLGLRLVASTVTSFLVLALLLFMVHRLRQRRLMMAMRRYQDSHLEQMDDFDERVIPEYWLQCPPYEDPPPPYTPPKPDHRMPPREAPPPYEEVPSNNNNINMTDIIQNTRQHGRVEQETPPNVSHVNHVRQSSDRIQDALNTELLQSIRFRQQLMSLSSSEESVDLSVPNHRAHYIRKSNSTANTGGLCNGNRNTSGAGNSDRSKRHSGVLSGTCRVGHSNSFAAPPSLPCGYDTVPWHKTGYSLPQSCSNTVVTRSRHGGQDRPIRKSHSGSSNVKQCSHRGALQQERGLPEPEDMCRLEEMSLESYNNNNLGTNTNRTADGDLFSQPSEQRVVADITDTLEGYVPPSFQDQSDNRGTASSKRNKPPSHHQRYGSLPSNICTDTHMSASLSAGHVRSSSQDSAQTGAHVDPCPLLRSSEMTMPSNRYSRDQCDIVDRNELMTFRSPRRPQSLEHLRHPGHAFNVPDISTISESGLSGNDSISQQQPTQQQQNLQDLQALRELRLSNLLRSPECGPVNIANSPPSPVQPLSIQGAGMPRSSSIVSDVSMFSVCSETGEKKLSQITGQALRSDAQYPENAFVGRPTLSVFSGGDNCISTNRLPKASENAANGNIDNQNGNDPENSKTTVDTCAGNESGCDNNDRGLDVVNRRKDEKQKSSRENRLPHVKLRHKNKHRTHRSSSGSTSSGKKRHSLTSDSPSESATSVRPLPRSRSEVKHTEQLSALRKQYRTKKGDPQFVHCDMMPPAGHSHHSFHGEPDYVTYSPGANNWGEVSGLYAVTSIMGDVRHSKSKSKLSAANKSGSVSNKQPNSPTDGSSSLFCPTNVAFVKKKVKSSKRGRHGNAADQRSQDIKISGYSQNKILNSDLDIELSPMHELSDKSTKFKDSCIVDNKDGVLLESRSNMDNNNYSM